MKIGIVSDIHEAVDLLAVALERLDREGVDRILVLGDVFETGPRMDETVALLEEAGAVGVYGNHDYGLSVEPSEYVRESFSPRVIDFMATLLPRLEMDGCLFAHREPYLDCAELEQIWHVDEEDLPPGSITRSFDATPHRSIFIGHYHRWQAFDREGPLPWLAEEPLALVGDGPTMVVVHAVCDGYAATFDTATRTLTPCDLYQGRPRPECRPLPPVLTG